VGKDAFQGVEVGSERGAHASGTGQLAAVAAGAVVGKERLGEVFVRERGAIGARRAGVRAAVMGMPSVAVAVPTIFVIMPAIFVIMPAIFARVLVMVPAVLVMVPAVLVMVPAVLVGPGVPPRVMMATVTATRPTIAARSNKSRRRDQPRRGLDDSICECARRGQANRTVH
jgi:hypothetical protein